MHINKKFLTYTLAIAVVFFGIIIPRVYLIGGYPRGDEGTYATIALSQFYAPFSDFGTFWLYSRLSSFIFYFDGNHILYLRLLDMFISCVAAVLMFLVATKLISTQSIAFISTIVFLIAMNQSVFIHNGFANPIFAACAFLFGALLLVLRMDNPPLFRQPFIIGFVVGWAVLFREPFVLFGLAIGFYILVAKGFRPALAYMLGGLLSLAVAIVGLNLIGIRAQTIFSTYLEIGSVYTQLRGDYSNLNPLIIFIEKTWPLILFVFVVNAFYVYKLRDSRLKELWDGKWLLFIIIALVPIIETLIKYSAVYTFALSLPGLMFATLISLNFIFESLSEKLKKISLGGLAILVIYFGMNLLGNIPNKILWPGDLDGWASSGFKRNTYLMAAHAVTGVSKDGDTLAMTGDLYPIFPVTLMPPINFDMADLDRTVVQQGMNAEQMSALLKKCSPDIIFLSSIHPETSAIVAKAIDLSDIYNLVWQSEPGLTRFGDKGAFVFRLKDEFYKLKAEKFCKKNIKNI
jgi:hypothetical protein